MPGRLVRLWRNRTAVTWLREMERNQLGEGAFLGDEVWDQQSRFRIRLGPLGLDRFIEFLPDAPAMGSWWN